MRVIFLDRDGVINRYPGDSDYVKSWDEFHFLPKAKSGLNPSLQSFAFSKALARGKRILQSQGSSNGE